MLKPRRARGQKPVPDGGSPAGLNLHLWPKQFLAFCSAATELLFGGAAGPGKSHLLRVAAIMWCTEIPGLQVYIFRRVEDDLIRNHMEGPKGFRNMLAEWVNQGWCSIVETQIRFWNGSHIYLCHCKDEAHRYKYHGAEIHVLMMDELTTFTEIIYRYLRFRVRMVGIKSEGKLPEKYRKGFIGPDGEVNEHDLFPRIVNASNPGNIGHHWVKRTWGLDTGTGIAIPTRQVDIEGGMVRQYIGARLSDNPSMEEDDPTYRARMRGLGDPALVKAMEEGDWNIIAGGFFPEFSLARHVLKALTPPLSIFTRRFIAEDWGSAKPFSIGWYGIADEDWRTDGVLGNQLVVPRGALVRYREWYGKKEGQDNVGLKMPVDRVQKGIYDRTANGEPIRYQTVDPSMFSEDGGPSLAERAMKVHVKGKPKVVLRPADNTRVGPRGHMVGWDQVRARLNPTDDPADPALLFLMDNQPDAIRVIQAVQHDETRVEDLDTDSEDHPVDEIRYGCMSRPLPAMRQEDRKIGKGPKPGTFDWLINMDKSGGVGSYRMD